MACLFILTLGKLLLLFSEKCYEMYKDKRNIYPLGLWVWDWIINIVLKHKNHCGEFILEMKKRFFSLEFWSLQKVTLCKPFK